MAEIPKAYEPQEIEERWAKTWFDEKLFRAENSADGPAFSIALPPPNITGWSTRKSTCSCAGVA